LRPRACINLVGAPLRQRLRVFFVGSLPRFDLMAQSDRYPQGLKMRELSRRLMVTGGKVTGLTDRLVAEGLVERRDDTQDCRACTIALTLAYRHHFQAMALAHEAWGIEMFSGLDSRQQAQLFKLLGLLKLSLAAKTD